MRLRKLLFLLHFLVNKETLLSYLSGYFDNWAKIDLTGSLKIQFYYTPLVNPSH